MGDAERIAAWIRRTADEDRDTRVDWTAQTATAWECAHRIADAIDAGEWHVPFDRDAWEREFARLNHGRKVAMREIPHGGMIVEYSGKPPNMPPMTEDGRVIETPDRRPADE